MTFEVNIHAMFYLTKAAVPHMKPSSVVINTASVNSDMPNPILLAYATTKGAIQNFTGGLARAKRSGARPDLDAINSFDNARGCGQEFRQAGALQRAGQPAELATAYVMLADPASSYTSGTTVAVTGGKPFI